MVYYMEIDASLEKLEIHECKNIHQVSKAIKISWVDINHYLNGTDTPVVMLNCGVIMPFIKRSGRMYLISYYKKIMEDRNYPWMSADVIEELTFMNDYEGVVATNSLKNEVVND